MNNKIKKYAIPGILGLVFNSLYIVVDGVFVAKMLGSKSLAAVTCVVPIVEILIAISMMISIGSGIYIATSMVKNKHKEAREYYSQGLIMIIIFSLVFLIISLVFKEKIAILLGATDDILAETIDYFKWFIYFVPFFMLNYALGIWIRNDGKPNHAMISQIVGAVLNVFLDYLFMGPMKMGIKGAAIATGLGPVVGILILAPHFLRKKGNLYFEKTYFSIKRLKNILIAGLPSFSIEFALGFTTFFCNVFLSFAYGADGLSAFGVIGYLNLILVSVFLGMGQGTQPLVSALHGKNDNEGIKEIFSYLLKVSFAFSIVSFLTLILFRKNIVSIFVKTSDTYVFNLAYKAIPLYFSTFFASGINILISSIFEAKQVVKSSISISLLRSFFILLPVLLVLNMTKNNTLLWLAVPISEFIVMFISSFLWIKDKNFEGKIHAKPISN